MWLTMGITRENGGPICYRGGNNCSAPTSRLGEKSHNFIYESLDFIM